MLQKVSCIADFKGKNSDFKDYIAYQQQQQAQQKPPVTDFKVFLAKEMAK